MLKIGPVPDHQIDAFAAVWLPWLQNTMGRQAEAEDLVVMADPMTYYQRTGGIALLAHVDAQVVGTIAVKGLGEGRYEFCKLVVTEAARGHGAGRALVQRCLDFTAEQGGSDLYLQSFRALDIALSMYRTMGFMDVPAPPGMVVLDRTEIIMGRSITTPNV